MSLFLQTIIKNSMFLLYLLIFSFSILSGCEENSSIDQNWQNVKTSDLPKSPDQSMNDQQMTNTSDSQIASDQQVDQQLDQQLIPTDMTLTDFAQDAQVPKVSRPNLCGTKVEIPVNSAQDFSYIITDGALIDTKIEFPAQTFASNLTLVIDCQMTLLAEYLLIEDLSALDLSQMADLNQIVKLLKPLSPQLILSIQGDHPDLKPLKKIKITHSYDASTAPEPFKAKAIRLLAQPKIQSNAQIINPPMINPVFDLHQGLVTYEIEHIGYLQLAYAQMDLEPKVIQRSYRAISGVSMGAGASAIIASKYPNEFDYVGALGGAVDWRYLASYIYRRALGGFCPAPQLGELCDPPVSKDLYEHQSTYLRFYHSTNGGDFNRTEYVKLFKDLAFAYGNPAMYHPESPYLATGLPLTELLQSTADRCRRECRGQTCLIPENQGDDWTKIYGMYDDEFNPDGMLPVIPFCDGEDGDPSGVFNDQAEHFNPIDLLLAVDLNLNGRRDANEPILKNFFEPFHDHGCDGLANSQEPNYDPIFNPDPNGDDFDWYANPFGAEGNFEYDSPEKCMQIKSIQDQLSASYSGQIANLKYGIQESWMGEHFDDFGLDGVDQSPQIEDGGFDFGEGDGVFTYNPNFQRMIESRPITLLKKLSFEERQKLQFWVDGGIRDIFNFGIAGLHFTGQIQGLGKNMRIYEKIETMAQTTGEFFFPSKDTARLFVDQYEGLMFLFGNPNASEDMILRGDGGHIGTELQAVNRFLAYFHWQHNQWQANPNVNARGLVRQEHLSIPSEAFKGNYQLEIVLPPGYDLPENANERYPVVLFLHGYGQTADNLAKSSGLFTKFMASNTWDKTIFVYPDGSCGKDRVTQCNDGIDNDGDGLIDARSETRQEATDPECADDEGRRSESGDRQPRCNDGVDNDGDGSADLSDEGCILASEDSEGECVVGGFYSKHVAQRNGRAGGRDFEGAIMDALRYVDANFRTKASEIVTINP